MEMIDRVMSFLRRRSQSYQHVFVGPRAEEVLADLAKFCRATESAFHPDPRVHAVLEGRREVWLRICQHLRLDEETIWKKYGPKAPTATQNEE